MGEIRRPGNVGSGLNRPESVIALKDGRVYASDKARGVVRVLPTPSLNGDIANAPPDFVPNGIALLRDGTFFIANVGARGGLWHLLAPGEMVPFRLSSIAMPETPLGHVHPDRFGRIWLAFTTRSVPRELAFRKNIADGCIGVIDSNSTLRICATGLSFPNEVRVHPNGRWLYVTETFDRRLTRYEIGEECLLSNRETICTFEPGTWPDGFELDIEGSAWVTSVVSNRLIKVSSDGTQKIEFENCDEALLQTAESHYQSGTMTWGDIAIGQSAELGNTSSVAFGGPMRTQMYIGSLGRSALSTWTVDVPGVEPIHWNFGSSVID